MAQDQQLPASSATDPGARIVVDPGRPIGRLDRNVFGGFVEHLGRCINGGIFDEGSSLSDNKGFRRDVLALLKPLKLAVLRWPGGNFASNCHWVDGIGPRPSRPARVELAWGGVEPNHFGTDEFLAYCADLGATPYICLNMGTGNLSEALDWVEYCNSAANSYWADQRRRNGREDPYEVVYWGLGNEMYGDWQVGQLSAEEYVALASRWAKAIRRADPRVKLVSCGQFGWSAWDRTVIDGLVGLVDLHSLHIYTGSSDYWTNVLSPHQAERAIAYASTLVSQAAYAKHVTAAPRIAYDEWNVRYRTDDGALEERYDFTDALAVATYLDIFVRSCEWVTMANLAQMVNAIAPIVTSPDGAVVQSIYYPFLLHSNAALDEAVDLAVTAPSVVAPLAPESDRWSDRIRDLGPFCVMDAAATCDRDRQRVSTTIVNRDPLASQAVEVTLRDASFGGNARVRFLTDAGDALTGYEAMAGNVQLEDVAQEASGSTTVFRLPPRSFTVFEAPIEMER